MANASKPVAGEYVRFEDPNDFRYHLIVGQVLWHEKERTRVLGLNGCHYLFPTDKLVRVERVTKWVPIND